MEAKSDAVKNNIAQNVRSMNQGKLEVGQTGDARVTVNILGISELKWTGMAVSKNPLEEAEPST